MSEKINICVGSLNPTKIEAVKSAFCRYYKNFEVQNIKVHSKVSNQPIGFINIIDGAINRAKQSLNYIIERKKIFNNIFGIGIEAGLATVPYTKSGFMDFQFCAIIDEQKHLSLGSGIAFEYPKFIVEQVLQDPDKEIGEIVGKLANNENLKNEKGAISFLSKNSITRTEILTQAVICALLPFINEELYNV
ncbi:MAG: inosine/xanthosine triphosphatase [Candidatus Hodarchaeota archaeon]